MEDNLVVKSNSLVQAKYELSLNEQKIILYAVSKLDTRKDNFNVIPIYVKEFFNLLGTTTERYTELRDMINELRRKTLIIDTGNGEIVTGWLSSLEYKKDTGIIEIEFSNKLVPYLLQLKEQFTRYQIKNILYLSNKHSIRIYELLKQYETIGKRTFKVEDIKKLLLLENQYNRFHDFERFILKTSMEEINDYTDINISYEKIKKGRSIDSIRYVIETKKNDEFIKYLENMYDIKDIKAAARLEDENFNTEQIVKLYEKAMSKLDDDLKDRVNICSYININYKAMLEKDNVINRFTYLMDMLEHDRAKAMVYIKINKKAD